MLTAGSREVCRCERGTKGSENNLMKAPRPGCVRGVWAGFLLCLCLSHLICFHRNAGTDPRICTRQGCLCDPDDVQVRWKTHLHTLCKDFHKQNTFPSFLHTHSWYMCLCEDPRWSNATYPHHHKLTLTLPQFPPQPSNQVLTPKLLLCVLILLCRCVLWSSLGWYNTHRRTTYMKLIWLLHVLHLCPLPQRCEHHHNGDADHGVCL